MEKALLTMIDNMPEKTGKSLEEWKSILKKKNFTKHSEGVKFLKNGKILVDWYPYILNNNPCLLANDKKLW